MCGSTAVRRELTTVKWRDGAASLVSGDVCSKCGEHYLDPEAIDLIARDRKTRRRSGRT